MWFLSASFRSSPSSAEKDGTAKPGNKNNQVEKFKITLLSAYELLES